MSAVVPFESQALPAHLASFTAGDDDLTAGVGGGFPVISIKGKVFTIVRGDEREIVMLDGAEQPAGSIDVIILKSNPALAKNYYAAGYEEGASEKPDCYSNDGVNPASDAKTPQAKSCAACPHNVWGSRISDNGNKGKSCADHRKVVVAPAGQINDPMLLRIPAASLKPLMAYGDVLKKRGVKYPSVLTRVSFDYTVAHPALTFKPVGFITAEMVALVQETMVSDQVAQMIGTMPYAGRQEVAPQLPAPVQAQVPVQVAKVQPVAVTAPVVVAPVVAAAPKPAPVPKKKSAFASAAPADTAPVAAAAPVPVAKPAAPTVVLGPGDDLDAALDKVLAGARLDDVAA